jgi:gliding motility-associated-like protein
MSGGTSGAITLNAGVNIINTIVTAQDGVTTKTYSVAVTRAPSANAGLAGLTISNGTLSPAFAASTNAYTASVANTVTSVTVIPTTADPTATVTVNGATILSGNSSGAIALNTGANTITTVVTAQDGVTTQTFTITITRAASSNAALAGLTISSGTLSPAFASSTSNYTANVVNATTSVTVTPMAADPTATIAVNGMAVPSGSASGAISLNVGPNTLTTVVTAQDGVTTQTYTVIITRAPATNANLSVLVLSKVGPLTPVFSPTITNYTANVGNSITSITASPKTGDVNATVTINGIAVTSGTASGPIALSIGANTITAVVTAPDGVTTKTYTVVVTRATGPLTMNSVYEPVSVAPPPASPQLADDGILVHQGVSPNGDGINDFLIIDGITNYPDNRLAVMNRNGILVFEAKGYDNKTKLFDGHSNKTGAMQLPGTYFYSLDYTANGVARHKTGFIVLKY